MKTRHRFPTRQKTYPTLRGAVASPFMVTWIVFETRKASSRALGEHSAEYPA